MPKLPTLSGKAVCAILKRCGFITVRQKGSHVAMQRQSHETTITVVIPMHDEIKKGTLLSIIRQSRMSRSEFGG